MAREGQWYEARAVLSRRAPPARPDARALRVRQRRALHRPPGQAFGLRVIAYDPYVSELEIIAAGVEPVSFGELLERSDYLSIHAPHNDETEHAINGAALAG